MASDTLDDALVASSVAAHLTAAGHDLRSAGDAVESEAQRCGMPFVNDRWLGGTLTNYETVKRSIAKYKKYQQQELNGEMAKLASKEVAAIKREMVRMHKNFSGIVDMPGHSPGSIGITVETAEGLCVIYEPLAPVRQPHNAVRFAHHPGAPRQPHHHVAVVQRQRDRAAAGADVDDPCGPVADPAMSCVDELLRQVPQSSRRLSVEGVWQDAADAVQVLDECGLPSIEIVSVAAHVVEGAAFDQHALLAVLVEVAVEFRLR